MAVAVCLHDEAEAQQSRLDVATDRRGVAKTVDGDAPRPGNRCDSSAAGGGIKQAPRVGEAVDDALEDFGRDGVIAVVGMDFEVVFGRFLARARERDLEALEAAETELLAEALGVKEESNE